LVGGGPGLGEVDGSGHTPSPLVARRISGPSFDGDGAAFRLATEALRIRMAGQHDAMLAVTTSDREPLPHQIKAV